MNRTTSCLTVSILFFFLIATRAESARELFETFSTDYENILVEKVLDADTIVLATGETIKLIGIRAPELPPKEKVERNEFGFVIEPPITPETPLEERSLGLARELMENQNVRLEFDTQKKGDDLATLAYVYLPDGRMVNLELLRQGLVYMHLKAPNLKYEDQFRAAYREARQEKRGFLADY